MKTIIFPDGKYRHFNTFVEHGLRAFQNCKAFCDARYTIKMQDSHFIVYK